VYSDWGNKGPLGLKQKLYLDWSTKSNQTLKYGVGQAQTRIGAQGLIRFGSMVYVKHRLQQGVYTNECGVCQAQTQIQEQRVLGSNQKCAALRFKHNVYSDLDWSSRV
jgi:hypothetical protein